MNAYVCFMRNGQQQTLRPATASGIKRQGILEHREISFRTNLK